MKDDKDKENDIEMNDGDSAEAPADVSGSGPSGKLF